MRYGLLLAVAPVAGCGPFLDGIGGSSDEIADAVLSVERRHQLSHRETETVDYVLREDEPAKTCPLLD